MPRQSEIAKARRRFKRFTGHDASESQEVDIKWPSVVLQAGECDGILYTTIRDGVEEKYIHKFAKNSRPQFCVSPDGKMLVLLGGAFKFTERGIVDKKR